eukprot:TCALIF_00769-PA protein Name:"Similar to PIP5K1 Phosphatidylinositol 4-phosphate 5-kinase 1 (Arabidopsis thaliana)" AED:0.31 eAED:0.31 QI:348/0.83/0.85/1/0.83/0.71/7/2026/403
MSGKYFVVISLYLVGPSRANIDPSLLAEIFGPAPLSAPTKGINPISDSGQRLDIDKECQRMEPCVLCLGFGINFDHQGHMWDCQDKCGERVVTIENYNHESNCYISFGGEACITEFLLPNEYGTILAKPRNHGSVMENGNVFEGELSGTCQNDEPKVTETGYTFITAQTETKKKANGFGTLTFKENDPFDRHLYQGVFRCGQRHGQGFLKWNDGSTYVGQFVNGTKSGEGKMIYSNGDSYEGSWAKDVKEGRGVYAWKGSGFKYIGYFVEGQREGRAEVYGASGQETPIFEGIYAKNVKAEGMARLKNGDTYTGPFKDNQFHGQGIYKEACGNVYVGEFLNGLKHGLGKFTWANGVVYEGLFSNDFPHGKGTITWKDGTCILGSFDKGILKLQLGDCYTEQGY